MLTDGFGAGLVGAAWGYGGGFAEGVVDGWTLGGRQNIKRARLRMAEGGRR
jgi:hypothetical protein